MPAEAVEAASVEVEMLDARLITQPQQLNESRARARDFARASRTGAAGDQQEKISCDWLVGCDGAHSTVRHQLGLDFDGEQYSGMRLRLMDVSLRGFPLSDDALHWLISTTACWWCSDGRASTTG